MAALLHPLSVSMSFLVFIAHVIVAARAITRPYRTPASRIAWVAVIMALPLVGIIAYLLLGETSIGRQRQHALQAAWASLPPAPGIAATTPPTAGRLFALGRRVNGFDAVGGNRIELLGDPAALASSPTTDSVVAIDRLIQDVERATDTVHICFYIWLADHQGTRLVDALCAAAARGVRCRVMVDDLGSRAFIKSPQWRRLRDSGVRVVATLNDIPRLGRFPVRRVDLRNHRKIVVIDNAIAYCGSQNCADPEFRVAAKFAPWIDILLRCEGPVVRQEQALFLSAWIAETGEQLADLVAAPPEPRAMPDGAVAQMTGTGPTTPGSAMSDLFVATIYAARRDLTVTTPYFVPDEALLRALCAAPRRGVRTRIVFPARNNSRLVGATCRSTYPALLEAGVEVYEYPLGLLHSKSITLDGEITLVGSANMDRRSLQLNFENNMLVADREVTTSVLRRQEGYVSVSHRVDPAAVSAWPWLSRLVQNAVGMMSPLL